MKFEIMIIQSNKLFSNQKFSSMLQSNILAISPRALSLANLILKVTPEVNNE